MTTNKQALREAAEKATPGRIGDRIDGSGSIKYECHGYDGSLVLKTDHKNMEYGFVGDNGDADELFFRLCVPDTVLALLDELEAEQRISSTWRKTAESNSEKLEAAEKRIAELEARSVIVPSVSDDAFWLNFNGRFVFREETYRSAVFKALDSVGIKNSAGTAKGE